MPQLWQSRCEDYFQLWGTPPELWISYATAQFEGAAARWLESVKRRVPRLIWDDFCVLLQNRFGRNQHQALIRRLFHISQTSTVVDYFDRFAELLDQITAYETAPDPLHYTTRFLDGLQPGIRILVALQQPQDLDRPYQLALLHEELGDGVTIQNIVQSTATSYHSVYHTRKAPVAFLALPPRPATQFRSSEDRRSPDQHRTTASEDKWIALKSYRRAKGLCFICGEKYSRDHKCRDAVQLHFVQEMVEFLQQDDSDQQFYDSSSQVDDQLMAISAAAMGDCKASATTMKLAVMFHGHRLLFLVDSGSTHSFLDSKLLSICPTAKTLPVPVRVANGHILQCTHFLPNASWTCTDATFSTRFQFIPLGSYDGILGLDWLIQLGPMQVDWGQKWMAFPYHGQQVLLQGVLPAELAYTIVELSVVRADSTPLQPEIQQLLAKFASVFADPTGLPPRRHHDRHIPLIPSARPISIRPYRVTPELKSEIEKQVQEMLDSGVITRSNSPFSSPVILVKKKGTTWRMVVDYRHLNALTIEGKYPLPVIDELLDELAGSHWFSKLDLKSGYHQIRLAPGEEHKTAFQTHHGHFEFRVMSFGLTGAPATFQSAMNATLAPVLRKFASVFFDDILINSKTFSEHVDHLQQVLSLLQSNHWQVKTVQV